MSVFESDYVVLDVETNGLSSLRDDLLSISLYQPDTQKLYNRFLPLELNGDVYTTHINGITKKDLKKATPLTQDEVNALIDAFIGYREMLVPIQNDLHDFLETYDALKNDVSKIDKAFSGDVQGKLTEIYKTLSAQAEKSEAFTRKVDEFLQITNKYTE